MSLVRKYINKFSKPAVNGVDLSGENTYFSTGGRRDLPGWVVVNDFRSTYFSGLDISVYLGETFVDEIIQLQFSEMEQVRPLFGYSDYTYRAVAHGSRIVQGSFSINFKDAGYIPKLLHYLKNEDATRDKQSALAALEKSAVANSEELDYLDERLKWPSRRLALSVDSTLEDLINTKVTESETSYDARVYASMMDDLKKTYWGEDPSGAQSTAAESLRASMTKPKYQMPTSSDEIGFDIIVKYGQPEDYQGGRPGWGTLECISDCHITGFTKSIDDSGRNIIESYTFIARSLS